jgi:hypothetical protein
MSKRREQEVTGVTMRQLYELVRGKLESYDSATSDPDAFCQDMCCEIEKLMGIFPNIEEAVHYDPR